MNYALRENASEPHSSGHKNGKLAENYVQPERVRAKEKSGQPKIITNIVLCSIVFVHSGIRAHTHFPQF